MPPIICDNEGKADSKQVAEFVGKFYGTCVKDLTNGESVSNASLRPALSKVILDACIIDSAKQLALKYINI